MNNENLGNEDSVYGFANVDLDLLNAEIQRVEKSISHLQTSLAYLNNWKLSILNLLHHPIEANERASVIIDGYNPNWQNIKKVRYFLASVGRAATIREIRDFIAKKEYVSGGKLLSLRNIIASTLSQEIGEGKKRRVLRDQVSARYHLYGLPEWFEDGKLKEEYLPFK